VAIRIVTVTGDAKGTAGGWRRWATSWCSL